MKSALLIILLLCGSCHENAEKQLPFTIQEFQGRDELVAYGQTVRRCVYRAKVPLHWNRLDPPEIDSLNDTTKPIVSFVIDKQIQITIHSFPTEQIEQRIPPSAQVQRWKQQLKGGEYHIESVGQGGFTGLFFEGKKQNLSLLAWSFWLDFDHYQTLTFLATTLEEEEHFKQMRADYTIKAVGPKDLIDKYRSELMLFANTFELIQEIPQRS